MKLLIGAMVLFAALGAQAQDSEVNSQEVDETVTVDRSIYEGQRCYKEGQTVVVNRPNCSDYGCFPNYFRYVCRNGRWHWVH